jgi:hypothetical protein
VTLWPETTAWRFSASWLSQRHDCTVSGILERCGGGCCTSGPGGTYWPARAYGDEPHTRCGYLGAQGCTLDPHERPVKCLLYPMVVNDQGTVVRHFRAGLPTSVCKGNAGNGPMLVDAMASSLVALLGPAGYWRVRQGVLAGTDTWVELDPAVAAAWQDEVQREHANLPPVPREGGPCV